MIRLIIGIIIVIAIIILFFRFLGQPRFNYSIYQENFQEQEQQNQQKSLYDRLGGIFAIAAVVDYFSDAVVNNPVAGKFSKNPVLRDWHTNQLARLPGLKFMRTLWLASLAGGPYKYTPTVSGKCPFSLENAHNKFRISPQEFDAVAEELSKALAHFKVPAKEKQEVLNAFAAHKSEVIQGYSMQTGAPTRPINC